MTSNSVERQNPINTGTVGVARFYIVDCNFSKILSTKNYMDRKLFSISAFSKESLPAYPCPSCGSPLELAAEDLISEETAECRRSRGHPDFGHEWVRLQFLAKLRCPSKRCAEVVHCIGTGAVEEEPEFDSYTGQQMGMEYSEFFTPQYFIPHLSIVQIPDGCSNAVAERMCEAFKLFFASPSAALNALRSALESVLDDLDIPREKDRGNRMSLHARINEVGPEQHGLRSEWLHALKIMGNSGTHGEAVDLRQLLDGCEVMEAVLSKVYEKHQLERISQIATATIERKK